MLGRRFRWCLRVVGIRAVVVGICWWLRGRWVFVGVLALRKSVVGSPELFVGYGCGLVQRQVLLVLISSLAVIGLAVGVGAAVWVVVVGASVIICSSLEGAFECSSRSFWAR